MKNYSNKSNYGKNNNRGNNKGNSYIDISAVYRELKSAISERARLQEQQRNEWGYVRRGYNRTSQLNAVDKNIGTQTHRINKQIALLVNYKKVHKAMDMACGYLRSEISRIDKIIASRRNYTTRVEMGLQNWIRSDGSCTSDCTSSYAYMRQKQDQKARLQRQLAALSRYAA